MKLLERKRIGKFQISTKLIEDKPNTVMNTIMRNFIITRAEHLYHGDCIEYIGISLYFRPLEDGEQVPLYIISLDSETGNLQVEEEGANDK